jgi:hypothetical protein
MGFILDGRNEEIAFKKLSKIASGKTGDVYKYKKSALKIFKEDMTPPIDEETARHLTGIDTQRILLPRNLLFYNKTFRGYTYRLVEKKGTGRRMITLPIDELIGNISILENDIEKLSEESVLLNGIDQSNCIFNGDLFISDPREYSILEDIFSIDELRKLNNFQLHLLITAMLASETKKCGITNAKERQFREILALKDEEQNTSDFFADIFSSEDNVKEYVLKM